MKHWEQTFTIYVYNHCNIYNILIYFCNIHLKQLQPLKHKKTFKHTLATCVFSISQYLLVACEMEARLRVEFTRASCIVATIDQMDSAYEKTGGTTLSSLHMCVCVNVHTHIYIYTRQRYSTP
jgi:hypothetical protein